MALPKYQKKNVKVNTVTEQFGGLADSAEAQGQANIAAAQRGLSAQQSQRTNMELQSFSQRLSQFNQKADMLMGLTAKNMAVDKANEDLLKRKERIQLIKNDPSLTQLEKQQKITEESLNLTGDFLSVYGSAYDNTAKANFANETVIQAADQAMKISEMTPDNPTAFKETFKEYQDIAVKNAPDAELALLTSRAYDKAGSIEFKSLYNRKQAKIDREAKASSLYASKVLMNEYINALSNDNVVGASEAKAALIQNKRNAVANGYETEAKAIYDIANIDNIGQQQIISNTFEEEFKAGNGVAIYEQFLEMKANGDFDQWKAGTSSKMASAMQAQLKEKATLMADQNIDMYKLGRDIPPEAQKEMDTYLPFLKPSKQAEYITALAGIEVMKPLKGLPLAEQLNIVTKELTKKTLTPVDVKSLEWAKDSINSQIREVKTDPMQRAATEGIVELESLTPGMLTPEQVETRYSQEVTVSHNYGAERKFFTNKEADYFASYVDSPDTMPSDKIKLIATINKGTKGQASSAWRQLSKKGAYVFSGAGAMVQEGKTQVARDIILGDNYIQSGTVATDKEMLKYVVSSELGNGLAYSTKDDQKRVLASVEALAAKYSLVEGQNKSVGQIETKYIKKAIKDIMGDIGEYNNQTFFAPPGVDADDVIDFFDEVQNLQPIKGVSPGREKEVINNAQPFYLGDGQYGFMIDKLMLANPDGSTYILRYSK